MMIDARSILILLEGSINSPRIPSKHNIEGRTNSRIDDHVFRSDRDQENQRGEIKASIGAWKGQPLLVKRNGRERITRSMYAYGA